MNARGHGRRPSPLQDQWQVLSTFQPSPADTSTRWSPRADSIDGPWKVERMVQGESLGVTAASARGRRVTAARDPRALTLHQGGMCDTPSGEWWSIIMSDHGSAGRMVSLGPDHLGQRLSAHRPARQFAQGTQHLDQTQHRLHAGAQADLRSRRQLRQRQDESASGNGITFPTTRNGRSPKSPACCGCIRCRPANFYRPATAFASARPDRNPS